MKLFGYGKYLLICLACLLSLPTTAEDKRPLKMMYTEWPPFIYVNSDGQPSGFNIDIIRFLVEEKLGRKVVFQSAPWKRVQHYVLVGKADMFSAIPTAERRNQYMIGLEALFAVKAPIYTHKNHPRLQDIQAIQSVDDVLALNLSAIAVRGNGWHKRNVETKGVPTMKVTQARTVYKALTAGRGDVVIDLQLDHKVSSDINQKWPDIVDTGAVISQLAANLIFSRHSDHGIDMEALDAALIDMRESGITREIFQKYYPGLVVH